MELFEDRDMVLYRVFRDEYIGRVSMFTKYDWKAFVNEHDLGVRYIEQGHLHTGRAFHLYEIVDPKKWCVTRLRYGL